MGIVTTLFLAAIGFMLIQEGRTGLGAVVLAVAALRAGFAIRHWQQASEAPPPAGPAGGPPPPAPPT
jgi:hypothetical protein